MPITWNFPGRFKTKTQRHSLGLAFIIISSLFFSSGNILVKKLTAIYSSFTVVFWRGFIGLVIVMAVAGFNFKKLSGKRTRRGFLLLRGIVGAISVTCMFTAIKYTTVSNAISLFFTYPVFAAIIASIFFKERWKRIYLVTFFLSLLGVWLVVRPSFSRFSLGEWLALCSGILAGWVVNIIRCLRRSSDTLTIVFYFLLVVTVFSAAPAGWKEICSSIHDWSMLLIIGVILTGGQFLMTAGYKYCTSTEGGVISLSTIPITLLLSVIFLNEKITVYLALGAALIFLSGYLIVSTSKGR